jgi:hypothetical protein
MQHRSVLNIHLIADADGIDITTNHHVKPEAALVSGNNITYNHSIISQITITPPLWHKSAYFLDDGHNLSFSAS